MIFRDEHNFCHSGEDQREIFSRCGRRVSEKAFEIIEVADEKTPDKASETLEDQIRQKEAERILKNIKENAYCIALAIDGRKRDSVGLAEHIERLGLGGKSSLVFVIGGSLGLHDSVIRRADEKLSFSDMTFPHQLMRVILIEQIYRCYRIINGEPYHK